MRERADRRLEARRFQPPVLLLSNSALPGGTVPWLASHADRDSIRRAATIQSPYADEIAGVGDEIRSARRAGRRTDREPVPSVVHRTLHGEGGNVVAFPRHLHQGRVELHIDAPRW